MDSEWCSTAPIPPNDGMRMVTGMSTSPRVRMRYLARWLTIWSNAGAANPSNWISGTGTKPRIAIPIAIPTIADSASGVSKHRCVAECFDQSLGDAEHAAERRDVLAEHQHPIVGGHRVVQRAVDRLHHGQRRSSSAPG